MVYVELENNLIPVGNFVFIYDVTHNEGLFNKFYDVEKNLKVDYLDFAHKIRMAFEAFALEEEAKKRQKDDAYTGKTITEIKELIITEIKQPASIINYKNIIIDLCVGRETEFADMLYKYSFLKHPDDEARRKLKTFIRFIYAFGSESSHENVNTDVRYVPNRKNCFKVVGAFHDFLCVFYHVSKKYDSTLVPVRDYIPVPKSICEEMGLSLDVGKYLYVKKRRGKIAYYIFSSDIESISNAQRRDIDIINKLWEDNFDDPANIIRQIENISGSNGDYKFQVYSLPNKPLRLSEKTIELLSYADKIDIISGICKGVYSIHDYDPVLYHRNISPDAFYIFNVKDKYKALLTKFDCTKDTSINADFTVFNNVEKKVKNQKTNQFFAPEVLQANMGQGVNWEKADIYSLAKTCLYILTGQMITCDSEIDLLDACGCNEEMKIVLLEMLSVQPEDRPDIQELLDAIN